MTVTSEIIADKAIERLKKLGYSWVKVVKLAPPNGNKNWRVSVDIGIVEEKLKIIVFDKDGNFLKIE